jgi:hypothetical protein
MVSAAPGPGGPALLLAPVTLPVAAAGADYDSGPLAPAAVMGCKAMWPRYRLLGGQLPEGLTLAPVGRVTGQAAHAGEYQMRIEIDNGCMQAQVVVSLSVRGRAFLAVFDEEVELTRDQPATLIRVYSDRPGLVYSAVASEPWLRVKPLMSRTARPGEALAADLITVEVDERALGQAENPDGLRAAREATVRLECFRCRGTAVKVLVR